MWCGVEANHTQGGVGARRARIIEIKHCLWNCRSADACFLIVFSHRWLFMTDECTQRPEGKAAGNKFKVWRSSGTLHWQARAPEELINTLQLWVQVTLSRKENISWRSRMGDVEIINRLLEQTTHLVRQAWAPVLVGSNVCTSLKMAFLAKS